MKQFMGVDIGKHHLDVFCGKRYRQFSNNQAGIQSLLKWIDRQQKQKACEILVVFEATGGYERRLKFELRQANRAFHQAHPNKVRAFAKAKGWLAKTDKIDAKLIAHYAETMQLSADPLEACDEKLKELLKRREQLIAHRVSESNRLDKEYQAVIKESIGRHITWLTGEIKNIDAQLKQFSHSQEDQEKLACLTSVPGIGQLTGLYLMAYLPELGQIHPNALTALAGLAPFNRDSGSFRGKRFIQGGRSAIRRALYMSAVVSIRFNGPLAAFYQRLRQNGKSAKVALTAVMRKLLITLNSLVKRQALWQELPPAQ